MRIWMPTIVTGTGAQVYAEELAAGLTREGHSVDLEMIPFAFQFAPWFYRSKSRHNCDLIIANSWSAAAFAQDNVPLITILHHVVHTAAFAQQKTLAQKIFHAAFVMPMERSALGRSALIIAPSHATANDILATFGDYLVKTIWNGIDTDFFAPLEQQGVPRSDSRMQLLFVGKPSRRKGFDLIADLMGVLGDRAELTIVGSEGEAGLPTLNARKLGRVDRFRLREEVCKADFLLLPSRVEGFGYVAAEAMACGTPVACLAGGAVEEIVAPPVAGLILDPADLASSAEAMLRIVSDSGRMKAIRRDARERAVGNFSLSRWIAEFNAALREIAA